jgi:hypothetical protein
VGVVITLAENRRSRASQLRGRVGYKTCFAGLRAGFASAACDAPNSYASGMFVALCGFLAGNRLPIA